MRLKANYGFPLGIPVIRSSPETNPSTENKTPIDPDKISEEIFPIL